ncbi:uncharacterized protein B0J16DRAFT_188142 [Fusarium flagelliforme]|uniref:uncharacterized protein n=1 Tax=Fusarium flagelliforme TaxID=2675880 RepID=UPI001E8CF953|nr:uncharacterized protein B0J16DRAFT_188142 [Fusarium flagelliforme]KAH7173196.1 hypothetical protein B0J16DRAFT_188142 [Fusarium flagelliforme]
MSSFLQSTPNNPSHPSDSTDAAEEVRPIDMKKILRERQLARNRKACLPCRERKVRCNHQQPCQTCVKRGHSDLCFYDQPPVPRTPRREVIQVNQPATDSDHSNDNNTFSANPASHNDRTSIPTPSLLGGNSIISVARPNSAQPQSDNERRAAFETGIFPLLGMNEVSNNEQGPQPRRSDLKLADDREMIALFSFYRDRVHPFQFVIDDLDEIEKLVCSLVNRDKEVGQVDNHSLCLLHAILAAGAQFSDLNNAARVSKSREELKSALGCLGSFDLLWNPSKRLIQALLILGHVLQNDMNPRAAWILGGTTIRLALSIGLHQPTTIPDTLRLKHCESQHLRLAIVWQDALLSLAFGRPPASQEMNLESDLPTIYPNALPDQVLNYRQAMNWLCHLTLRHLRNFSQGPWLEHCILFSQDLRNLEASLAPHLEARQNCTSIQELQEHYSLKLHRNFVLSTFCRPILSTKAKGLCSGEDYSQILSRFQAALKESVRAFIKLRSMSNHATSSWALVHNGLSSALLLSFMRHDSQADETRQIQAELMQTLADRSEDVGQFSTAHKKALRAIQALQRLAEQDESRVQPLGSSNERQSTSFPEGIDIPFDPLNASQEQSIFSIDGWLRTFDFDAFSPLESYNFIMSDQVPLDTTF